MSEGGLHSTMRSGMPSSGEGGRGRNRVPQGADAQDLTKHRVPLKNAWQEARALIWTHRRRLGLGLVLLAFNRLAALVVPFAPKFLIDEVIGQRREDLLVPLALAVAAATAVQGVCAFALARVLGVAAQRAIMDMRKRVMAHIERLPVNYFDATQTGQLISRIMTDADGLRNLVGNGLVQFCGGIVTASVSLVILLWFCWWLTLINMVVLACFGGMMVLAFTKLRPLFRERGKLTANVTGRLSESLSGIRVIKAYSAERREAAVFAKSAHKLFRNVVQSITGVSAVTAFSAIVIGTVAVSMIIFGGQALVTGEMTSGDLFSYVIFSGLLAAPVIEMAAIGTQISEAFAGLDRIREVLRLPTEDAADEQREPLPALQGAVCFEDVEFEYQTGVPVLRGVSFTAPAGSATALVGSSGSGKSTLVSLVMTFNRPKAGRVLVDGHDLERVRLHDYRRRLGVVLQDNFLFDGTIAENICFARPQASTADLERAAKLAHAHDFILTFPEGYASIVGERGVKLSGGQRQRIAIARAILADPRILILDEATSSLDSESEAKIQDGLKALRHGRTTFVIAHRLSTIRGADQILVLEAGCIVERGTHAELFAKGGRYRELHDRQYQYESDLFINPGEDFTSKPGVTVTPKRAE